MKKVTAFLSLYGMRYIITQCLLFSISILLSILTIHELSKDIPTSITEFMSKLGLAIIPVLSLVFLESLIVSSANDKMKDFK